MTKIGLGCVQLGLPYGNRANDELMPEAQAVSILHSAVKSGIKFFDTAAAYGESERRIGRSGIVGSPEVVISTKIPIADESIWKNSDSYWKFCEHHLLTSFRDLGIQKLPLLQFHQCSIDFLQSDAFIEACKKILAIGYAGEIGVSVYHPKEAEAAAKTPGVTWLQIPVSILDLRFLSQNLMDIYNSHKTHLIARSILMQGILAPDSPLPKIAATPLLQQCRGMAQEAAHGQLLDYAFRFIFGNLAELLDIALIGVQSDSDLRENFIRISSGLPALDTNELDRFQAAREFVTRHGLYNPANWNRINTDENPT